MTTTPDETPALDDLETDPDLCVGNEVAPEHDLDVSTFPEDES